MPTTAFGLWSLERSAHMSYTSKFMDRMQGSLHMTRTIVLDLPGLYPLFS